ncbi:MAG: CaiB/BaiF CoA-transferase family protein, partial [Amylibacter sp.]|nr:CaiB/BaiF CoA-transferase family protein [Amylibacter sp.]
DFLVQGEAGVCSVTGTLDHPARVGVSMTDLSTGLTAYSAVLRALIKRGITKCGLDIKLSMFDVVADWMNMPLLQHRYAGGAPERSGLQHSFVAPYGAFQCRNGKFILLSIQNNREFSVFCERILNQSNLASDPRFIQNPERYANRAALDEIINAVFAEMDQEVLILALDRARIANAKLNDVADLSTHPFLNNSLAQIGATQVEMAALPIRTAGDGMMFVPALGAHTKDIRKEFME